MATLSLDHFSLRLHPSKMEETIVFYTAVLGLSQGDRPAFPFDGAWLYCGDTAVVHLIALGTDAADSPPSTGRIDHIAFCSAGLAETRRRLADLHVAYTERDAPLVQLTQLFIPDPNGVTVELVFQAGDR
jgi:catechol 2,3-dioxygenase-like lactoylglutathione lyase family enzyme